MHDGDIYISPSWCDTHTVHGKETSQKKCTFLYTIFTSNCILHKILWGRKSPIHVITSMVRAWVCPSMQRLLVLLSVYTRIWKQSRYFSRYSAVTCILLPSNTICVFLVHQGPKHAWRVWPPNLCAALREWHLIKNTWRVLMLIRLKAALQTGLTAPLYPQLVSYTTAKPFLSKVNCALLSNIEARLSAGNDSGY